MKLFLFGSTGDLVKRKIFPALQEVLPKDTQIYALGRRDFSKDDYKKLVSDKVSSEILDKIEYHKVNFEGELCKACEERLDYKNINFFYVPLPPKLLEKVFIFTGELKRKGFKIKLLVEKPFGEGLKSAIQLKKIIEKYDLEDDLFLSDHYLFKKEIINLKPSDFKFLRIVSIEKLGIENREHYDEVGALKDMIQGHFINILLKLIKREKIKKIKIEKVVRGQYREYFKETGKKSETETFIYLKLGIDKKEVELITGKGFFEKKASISIDDKTTEILDENPYGKVFRDFFNLNKTNFAKIADAIFSWEIIKRVPKTNLIIYDKNTKPADFIKKITDTSSLA